MRVKVDFANWNPDLEDYANPGLITADNVIHQPEGWVPAQFQTAGSFESFPAQAATTVSIMVKPFGSDEQQDLSTDLVYAQISSTAGALTGCIFSIGVFGETPFTTVSLGTLSSFSTSGIRSLAVSEIGQTVSVHAEAQTIEGGLQTIRSLGGYFTYTVTSL